MGNSGRSNHTFHQFEKLGLPHNASTVLQAGERYYNRLSGRRLGHLTANWESLNWLSNRIFKSFDDIVEHCCYAWNTFIHQHGRSCPSRAAIGPQWVTQLRIGVSQPTCVVCSVHESEMALCDVWLC